MGRPGVCRAYVVQFAAKRTRAASAFKCAKASIRKSSGKETDRATETLGSDCLAPAGWVSQSLDRNALRLVVLAFDLAQIDVLNRIV